MICSSEKWKTNSVTIYTKEYKILKTLYEQQVKTTLVIVEGNYGSGKTQFIKTLLSEINEPVLTIKHCSGWGMLQPISQAINEFNLENNILETKENSIPLASFLMRQLMDIILTTKKLVIYMDDIMSYDNDCEIFQFASEFLKFLLNKEYEGKVFMIVEASSDKKKNSAQDFLFDVKRLCSHDNHICLNNSYRHELKDYFYSLFFDTIEIDETKLKDILKAGFYNPLLILRLVRYLQDIKTIDFCESKGIWTCGTIDVKITSNYFKDYIQRRYDTLDDKLKDTLKKASYTGFKIDVSLLEKPIGILEAEQQLQRIEQISRLINKDINYYEFENDEVFHIIEDSAGADEGKQWHNVIGEYLEKKLSENDKQASSISLYNIAHHFKEGGDYKKALQYYIKAISICLKNMDYSGCVFIGNQALELNRIVSVDFFFLQYIWHSLAIAYQMTADYKAACTYYILLLEQQKCFFDIDYLEYNYGYALYNAGDSDNSKTCMLNLKYRIENIPTKLGLLIETLTILTGVYDQLGERCDSRRSYSQALDLSSAYENKIKYFRLLRCSNMFLSPELSIDKMQQAYSFFKEKHYPFEEAFVAHNLGMEYLFLLDFDNAEHFLENSQKIFESYCSNNVCFPLSAMGNFFAYKCEYGNALKFYEKALLYSFDDFITIVLNLNISQCYYKINNIKKSEETLYIAESLIKCGGSDLFVQHRNISFIKAMRLVDNQNFEDALILLKQAFQYEVDMMNYSYYDNLIAKFIVSISHLLNLDCERKYWAYKESILKGHIQTLYDEHVLWANLQFWGV